MENKENSAATEVKEAITEVATVGTAAVAEVKKNYITAMLEHTMQKFMEVNAGLDLDFVRMGEWIKIDEKGNFVLRSDEDESFGDSMDIVIAQGEQRYMLWGKEASPEDGDLVAVGRTREDAEKELQVFLDNTEGACDRYTFDDIKLRYLAYVVPVASLTPEDMPDVFLLNFAPGDTIGFANYAKSIFRGIKATGVKKNSGVNQVVTRVETEGRKATNGKKYIGIKFEAVGPFVPAEYGIQE